MVPPRITCPDTPRRIRSRGQVVVMFALSIVLFVGLCAVVVDVAYYWVTTLRAQRAADAAALAGAVYLPGDRRAAYAEAQASAAQNDYTPASGVQDSRAVSAGSPPARRHGQATRPAFFARVVVISSFPVTRSSKGVYVLPVPMGSPLAYYGVGDFSANDIDEHHRRPTRQVSVPGLHLRDAGGTWTNPDHGWATGTTNFATSTTNDQAQQWPASRSRPSPATRSTASSSRSTRR